jgi:ferredoxin
MTAAQSAVPDAAAAAAEASASANLCEDVCIEDAVGLHEEQHGQELGELEAHDDGDMFCERCGQGNERQQDGLACIAWLVRHMSRRIRRTESRCCNMFDMCIHEQHA